MKKWPKKIVQRQKSGWKRWHIDIVQHIGSTPPLPPPPMQQDNPYMQLCAVTRSIFSPTRDTQYHTLTGELLGVYYDDFQENWYRYDSTPL